MTRRDFSRWLGLGHTGARASARTLAITIAVLALLLPGVVAAQDGDESANGGARYTSAALGVAFDLPDGWQVAEEDTALLAGQPGDIQAVQNGEVPAGLVVRIVFGTFNQLGITDATQLPDLLARLVTSDMQAPTPERIEWGNASGYAEVVRLQSEGITSRMALLAIAGGRVAVLRALAPAQVWNSGAAERFEALAGSLIFSLPERDANLLENIASNDGGVLWHFSSAQPESGRAVDLGGITFDMFDVMYVAAGPGGVLALEMPSGAQISYMGPWINGNFVDVAIGTDTRLYMANTAPDTSAAVAVIDRAGNWARGWGARGDGPGEFAPGMPQTIAVSGEGNVWTVSEGHSSGVTNRLYKFDSFGNLLLTVDLDGVNPDLSGVHIDNNPRTQALYLVGATGNINVVDLNGKPLVVNLAQEILSDVTPTGIAIAPNGNIVLTLAEPGLDGFGLLSLSVAGQLLDAFGFPYDAERGGAFLPGEYHRPGGIVIGPDGTGYWTETHPDNGYSQVQRFTFTGDGQLPLGNEMAGDDAGSTTVGSADPSRGGGSLSYGQTVKGALNNRYPTHTWTFEGTAGDRVVITMVDASGANLIDPQLSLIGPNENVIAANDDVGAVRPEPMGELDARIEFALPSTGLYTIEAGRFGGRGEYLLTLERQAAQ